MKRKVGAPGLLSASLPKSVLGWSEQQLAVFGEGS